MNYERQCRCLACAISGNVLPYNDPEAWVRMFIALHRTLAPVRHSHPPAQERRAEPPPKRQHGAS